LLNSIKSKHIVWTSTKLEIM